VRKPWISIPLHARGYIGSKGLNIFVARMGCTPSKDRVEGGLNAAVSLPVPVDDFHQAERKEEPSSHGDGFYKLRKDQDDQVEDSSSGWSKVRNLLAKYKSSFKTNHGNSKKNSSNDNLQEEEGNKVGHRKSVDRSLRFHAVNMKDIEQLVEGKAEPRVSIWQRVTRGVKVADESLCLLQKTPLKNENSKWCFRAPPGGENRVVLYFTSLRGIRKTFDNCCIVKLILCGFRVLVDERDISMHAPFRQELQDLLGKPITVPRLFIAGKYIGGVEDILQLHEAGELVKYLEGFPRHTGSIRPCHGCGDSRFVPCLNCDGSRKIFTQKLGGQGHGRIVWVRCPCCNENGIIRCPVCCVDAAFVCSVDAASVKT
jgi:glutaredoxin-related protein